MRIRLYPFLIYSSLLALLVGGGVVNGLVNNRWAPAAQEEAPQLDRLSMSIGDWDGTTIDADPDNFPEEQVGNMVLRRYVRKSDGAAVMVFLTAGRAGPMVAAHMPDSCYPGAGYQFVTPTTRRTIPAYPSRDRKGAEGQPLPYGRGSESEGRTNEFRMATFSKTERALPLHLRVYWAWSATGEWRVPDYPRLTFAGQRWLYKLYVIRQLAQGSEPVDGDAAESFLQDLTSEMERVFFAHLPARSASDGYSDPSLALRAGSESRNGSVK